MLSKFEIDEKTGCWNWKKSVSRNGYGVAFRNGKNVGAHRLAAYTFLDLDSDPSRYVLHRCDNRLCVNPKHLFLGTQTDNMQDSINKGRNAESRKTHCPKGHPYSAENTYLLPSNQKRRRCKTCRALWDKEKAERLSRITGKRIFKRGNPLLYKSKIDL